MKTWRPIPGPRGPGWNPNAKGFGEIRYVKQGLADDHEKSITVGIEGRHINLPTVIDGKEVSADQAVEQFRQGKLRPLGQYSMEADALREAEKRSRMTKK